MEEALKVLLRSKLVTSITFGPDYFIHFTFGQLGEQVKFSIHNKNEKLPQYIELFKRSKQKITISILDDFRQNEKLIRHSLMKLNLSYIYYYISQGNYLSLTKKPKKWIICITKDHPRDFQHMPLLYFGISGYNILVGAKIERNRQNDSIWFSLQVGNKEVTLKRNVHIEANCVQLWIDNETIQILHADFDINREIDGYNDYETQISSEVLNIHDFDCMRLDFVLVNGLGGRCGSWSDFLMRGLYDPRLFLLVAAFFDENFCY